MSLKTIILQASDLDTMEVAVPEWGCTVYLRELTAAGFNELAKQSKANDDEIDYRLLIEALVDADGNQIFSMDDLPALKEKSANVLARLLKLAAKQNGLTADEKN